MDIKRLKRRGSNEPEASQAAKTTEPKLYMIPDSGIAHNNSYYATPEEAIEAATPKYPNIYKLAHRVSFDKVVEDVES